MNKPPDLTGTHGHAWKLVPTPRTAATGIGSYLVNIPGAHPFWEWWYVGACNLRDAEGFPPAHKQYPEAEYEINIVSMNPDVIPNDDHLDGTEKLSFLQPHDATVQFHGPLDDGAAAVLDLMIQVMIAGEISPDSDFRSVWESWIPLAATQYTTGNPAAGDA